MKTRTLIAFCLIIARLILQGQTDSIKCDENFRITEGIYLSYGDFRRNNPILREEVESKINKDQLDFFGKTLDETKFAYSKNGQKAVVESKTVWGFYQNNTLHVNYNKDFYRVPVFGSICYLIAAVEVITPSLYTPGYGGMMGTMGTTVRTKEIRNFLMNFYDGVIEPFSMEFAEQLISRDEQVYAEYKKLRKKQQREQISRYIRKYNEAHPVYFLK